MTPDAIRQRQDAGRIHGAYGFRDRGEVALEQPQRTRLAELRELVHDRSSLLDLMQEKCADSILLFEIVQSYVSQQVKSGVLLEDIAVLNKLPAFSNSMQRFIQMVLLYMPDDKDVLDIGETIAQAVRDHEQNT
jgi:hypothetical protein